MLIRLVHRDAELQLYGRELVDIERYWITLQKLIDAATLRQRRLSKHLSDEARAKRHGLQQVLLGYKAEQGKVDSRQDHVRRMLGIQGAMQVSESHALFRSLEPYIERAATGESYIRLTPQLEQLLRDAAEVADFVRTQEEDLKVTTEQWNRLQFEPLKATNSDREAQNAVARLQGLSGDMKKLRRAMPARHEYRDNTLHTLYALARHVLLMQGLMEPESGERRTRPAPATGYNDDPGTPPLDPEDVKEYQGLLEFLARLRETHDNLQDEYEDELAEHLRESPDSNRTAFDAVWFKKRQEAAHNLGTIEKAFMELRDRVLRAGGEPLAQGEEARDLDQFAGRHPQDGTVGCMSAAMKHWLKEKTVRETPWINSWLGEVVDGATADGSEHNNCGVDEESRSSLDLVPWDSVSQQERRPRAKIRLDAYRRSWEQNGIS